MNEYKFEELHIGQAESFHAVITERMMEQFKEITGDINPLHNEESYARGKGYAGRVVYGLLTSSFLSTLAGVYLPGKYCLIHQVEVKMARPVYIGDTLTVSGVIQEIHESVRQIKIKVSIINQDGVKVLKGTMKAGVENE